MFLAVHKALSWEWFLVPCGTVLAWSPLPGAGLQAPRAVGTPSGLEARCKPTSSFGQNQFYLQKNPSLLIFHCFNTLMNFSLL